MRPECTHTHEAVLRLRGLCIVAGIGVGVGIAIKTDFDTDPDTDPNPDIWDSDVIFGSESAEGVSGPDGPIRSYLESAKGSPRQSGMLPCFRDGLVSLLFASMRSPVISLQRVSRGSITSSM
jgi:hypothetical protein